MHGLRKLMLNANVKGAVACGSTILHLDDAAEGWIDPQAADRIVGHTDGAGLARIPVDCGGLVVRLAAHIRNMEGQGLGELLFERGIPALRNSQLQIGKEGCWNSSPHSECGTRWWVLTRSRKRGKRALACRKSRTTAEVCPRIVEGNPLGSARRGAILRRERGNVPHALIDRIFHGSGEHSK